MSKHLRRKRVISSTVSPRIKTVFPCVLKGLGHAILGNFV